MSLIAEFTIETSEFLLGEIVGKYPDLTIEIERIVPVKNRVMPYLWAYGDDLSEFEEEMQADPHVRRITVLDRLEDSALFKVEWEEVAEHLIAGITKTGGSILEARGDAKWFFRVRFEEHGDLSRFHEYCVDNGIKFQLERVHSLAENPLLAGGFDLTEPQREALVLAVERGYFKVPREVTFAELAAKLDVSEQAVSERVRRGADAVLRRSLLAAPVVESVD